MDYRGDKRGAFRPPLTPPNLGGEIDTTQGVFHVEQKGRRNIVNKGDYKR